VGLGLRRGEVLGLKWDDVDFEKNNISIKRSLLPDKTGYIISNVKTAKSKRTIAVPINIINCLKREKLRQAENKLFLGEGYNDLDMLCSNDDGTPITPHAFNHRFSNLLKENNLPHVRIHDLRHTNASLMLKQGISMKVASDRLGHTTIGITMDLYTHVDEELQQDAADRLNNILAV
jgi:integrase